MGPGWRDWPGSFYAQGQPAHDGTGIWLYRPMERLISLRRRRGRGRAGRTGKDKAGIHMKNAWKIGLALLCFGLWLGMGLEAVASKGMVPLFEDGETVGFIGDSITHVT